MFCHRLIIIISLISGLSCSRAELFRKELSNEDSIRLSKQLMASDGHYYYQGTVADQLMIDEALRLDPLNARAWQEKGTADLKRGIAVEAMKYYDKAVELDPVTWQGWRGYLYLYFYRDFQRAIADFNATDTLTPGFTDHPQGQSVDYMRGISYYGLKDYPAALDYFSRYIEEETSGAGEKWVDVNAFMYRGLVFEKLDRYELAQQDFDKVLKYDPNLSDGFYHKSRLCYKQADYEKAATFILKAREQFEIGYFHQRPYVEVLEQIYLEDIEFMKNEILSKLDASKLK